LIRLPHFALSERKGKREKGKGKRKKETDNGRRNAGNEKLRY
jgi:hypothetical protein